MRLFIKIFFGVGILVFIAIQFFQPKQNISENSKNHIFQHEQIPENVQLLLKNACMDCHSNQTTYLWYHKISPVSWLVNYDVTKGKKELNFSEWGEMDAYDKFGALEDIQKEVERKTMPVKIYKIMHKDARFSDEEVAEIVAWCKKRSEEITKQLSQ